MKVKELVNRLTSCDEESEVKVEFFLNGKNGLCFGAGNTSITEVFSHTNLCLKTATTIRIEIKKENLGGESEDEQCQRFRQLFDEEQFVTIGFDRIPFSQYQAMIGKVNT